VAVLFVDGGGLGGFAGTDGGFVSAGFPNACARAFTLDIPLVVEVVEVVEVVVVTPDPEEDVGAGAGFLNTIAAGFFEGSMATDGTLAGGPVDSLVFGVGVPVATGNFCGSGEATFSRRASPTCVPNGGGSRVNDAMSSHPPSDACGGVDIRLTSGGGAGRSSSGSETFRCALLLSETPDPKGVSIFSTFGSDGGVGWGAVGGNGASTASCDATRFRGGGGGAD
jgi:hypothetical protein